MVEMGHFPSCPPIEIRRPWNSSSQTFSTVPAFPSVRTTALPTSSDWASSNAPRITDARSFTDGMDVSEVRRVSRRDLTESADPAQCGGHSCAFLKGDSHAALSASDDDRERISDRITLLRLYVENATQWNLDRQGTRAVTIQIDAASSTACSLAKGARASRIELAAAARTSGGWPSSARAAGPISSAPSTAASRPCPTATSSERL